MSSFPGVVSSTRMGKTGVWGSGAVIKCSGAEGNPEGDETVRGCCRENIVPLPAELSLEGNESVRDFFAFRVSVRLLSFPISAYGFRQGGRV